MARILVIDDDAPLRRALRALLERSGHAVTEAEDGQQGLTRLQEAQPDLILLDFIMPRMNGFQFCAALRAIGDHRDTPVILLSARTEKVGENFVRRFGLRDAISKPFDDDTLMAVVGKVLRQSAAPTAASPIAGPAGEAEPEDERGDPTHAAATQLSAVLTAAAPELPAAGGTLPADIAEWLADHREARLELLAALEALPGGPSISGTLAAINLGELMQLFAMQRQTGVLELRSDVVSASIQLREGRVEFASASGVRSEFLLGRYLVEEELVSRQDLDLLLRNRTGKRLLGDQLVKLGYITAEELARVLARQTSDILFEVLRWSEGRFRLLQGEELPGASGAGSRLEVVDLVMEGLRRVDEWRLIEAEIPDLDTVVEPSATTGKLFDSSRLSEDEAYVLGLIEGPQTVRKIVDLSSMGSFDACKIIYRLLSLKLLERVGG